MLKQLILPLAFAVVPVVTEAQSAVRLPESYATAEARRADGDLSAARKQFLKAAGELSKARRDASPALKSAADMAYALGDKREALALLDEAGRSAARYGDAVRQTESVLAAAHVAAELGERKEARARLARLAELEQSPTLPEALRQDVRRALVRESVGVR